MSPSDTIMSQTGSNYFSSQLVNQHSRLPARSLNVQTPHGSFQTPAFMPVGTRAAVNCLSVAELNQTASPIILGGNTYHMLVNPGLERIQALGGMHQMMGWHQPMLTDSGGYQIFSLSQNSKICRIHDNGASFKHPDSGRVIEMTPEISIQAQKTIGADIIMAFDECTPEEGGYERAQQALERTHRWLLQSHAEHARSPYSDYGHYQALFGIVQGGCFKDLREHSAQFVSELDLDGIAIGGEVIGYNMAKTQEVMEWVRPYLPRDKVRYTMGVGLGPQDLIDAVAAGADIFDCVAPTRNARHGALYCGEFVYHNDWLQFVSLDGDKPRMLIKKQQYARDNEPIMPGCDCWTCQHHTRAYLHYLFKSKQSLYVPLACLHNVRVMQRSCELMQELIKVR